MAARVRKKPDLYVLPPDHSAEITWGFRAFFNEDLGDFLTFKANDEVVVHGQRCCGHVGRTDEDGLSVANQDFLMHQSIAMHRMEVCIGQYAP